MAKAKSIVVTEQLKASFKKVVLGMPRHKRLVVEDYIREVQTALMIEEDIINSDLRGKHFTNRTQEELDALALKQAQRYEMQLQKSKEARAKAKELRGPTHIVDYEISGPLRCTEERAAELMGVSVKSLQLRISRDSHKKALFVKDNPSNGTIEYVRVYKMKSQTEVPATTWIKKDPKPKP